MEILPARSAPDLIDPLFKIFLKNLTQVKDNWPKPVYLPPMQS